MALTKIKETGIADDAIPAGKIASGAVVADITSGSVTATHLAGSIPLSKTNLTAGNGISIATDTVAVNSSLSHVTSVGTLGSLSVGGHITYAQSAGNSIDLKGDRTDAQTTLMGGSAGAGVQLFGSTFTNYAGALFLDATASSTGTLDAMVIMRTGSSPTEALRLDRSQNATFAGNLIINGSSSRQIEFKDGSTSEGAIVFDEITNGLVFKVGGTSGSSKLDALKITSGGEFTMTSGSDMILNLVSTATNGKEYEIQSTDAGNLTFVRRTGSAAEILRFSGSDDSATFAGNVQISGANYDQLKIKGSGTESGIKFIDSGGTTDGFVYASGESIGFLAPNGDWNIETSPSEVNIRRKLSVNSPDGWFNDDYVMHVYGQNGSGDGAIALGDFGHYNNTKSTWGTLLNQHSNGFNIECRRGGEEFKWINSSRTPLHIYASGQTVITTTDSSLQVSPLNDIVSYGGGGWTSYYRHDSAASSWWMNTTIRDWRFYTNQSTRSEGVKLSNGSTSWSSISSDERLKDNWKMFDDALGKINTLTKIGTYNKIDPETKEVEYDGLEIVGLSAQEVQKILPTAVTKQEDEEYWGLNYQDVFVLMVKAIQELSAEVEKLKGN